LTLKKDTRPNHRSEQKHGKTARASLFAEIITI